MAKPVEQPAIVQDLDFDPSTAMIGQPPIAGEPLVVTGDSRMRQPVVDQFTVTQRLRESFGDQVRPGDMPYWLRNAQSWEKIEMLDRGDQFLDSVDGAYIPLRDGRPKRNGDLILGFIPAEIWERQQREEQAAAEAHVANVTGRHQQIDAAGRKFDRTAEALQERHDEELRRNLASGITGHSSPTSGLDINQAYGRFDETAVANEEAMYRSGGQRRSVSQDQADALDRARSADKGSKSFSMSGGRGAVEPTPGSALGQVRARNGK
jgi:hypothetical protein